MTNGTGTRHDFTGHDRRNPFRKNLSQTVFGAAALACVALGCAWTLGTGVDSGAVSANVAPVSGGVMTFSARFDALGAGPEGMSMVRKLPAPVRQASDAIRKTYMTLLDVTYSLGPPPGSFSTTMPRGPDRQLAMLPPDQSDAPAVVPPHRAAESKALPAPRPSTLRLLASREVAKAKEAILSVTGERPSILDMMWVL